MVEPRRGRQNLRNTSRATGAALADEGAKGVMLDDSPPHQPQKKKEKEKEKNKPKVRLRRRSTVDGRMDPYGS